MIITGALMAGAVVLAKNMNKKNKQLDVYQIAKTNLDLFRNRFCEAMIELGSQKHQALCNALNDFCDMMVKSKGNKELYLKIQELAIKYKWSERQIGKLQCDISTLRPTENGSLSRIMYERAYIKFAFAGDISYVSKNGVLCEQIENQTLAWLCNGRIAYPTSYEKIFGGMISEEMFVATCKGANSSLVRKYNALITSHQIYAENYNSIIDVSNRIVELTNTVNWLCDLLNKAANKVKENVLNIRDRNCIELGLEDKVTMKLYEESFLNARIVYDIAVCPLIDDYGNFTDEMTAIIKQYLVEENSCNDIVDDNRYSILNDDIAIEKDDFNIRIINDRNCSEYTVYSIAYKKDCMWQKISINAKLCIDERLRYLSIDDIDYLLNDLDIELGISEYNTNIYYIGKAEEYEELCNKCSTMYSNVKVIHSEL